MMRKKYMPRALGPLLLVVLSPAVAQQNDDNEIIVSASRSNRTVAEMAQTTWVIENAELEQQIQGGKELKDALAQLIPGLDVKAVKIRIPGSVGDLRGGNGGDGAGHGVGNGVAVEHGGQRGEPAQKRPCLAVAV